MTTKEKTIRKRKILTDRDAWKRIDGDADTKSAVYITSLSENYNTAGFLMMLLHDDGRGNNEIKLFRCKYKTVFVGPVSAGFYFDSDCVDRTKTYARYGYGSFYGLTKFIEAGTGFSVPYQIVMNNETLDDGTVIS